MSALTEMTNLETQSRSVFFEKNNSVYLVDGPTFFSLIPFHIVRASIYEDKKLLSEIIIEPGKTFQWDPTLLSKKKREFQVFAYCVSNGREELVGVLRGDTRDLMQRGTFYLIHRSL